MPKTFDLKIFGDKQLAKAMKKLEFNVQKKISRKALRKTGKLLLTASKSLAPKNTGKLRKFLKVRAQKKKGVRGKEVAVVIRTGTRAEMGIPQGKDPATGRYRYYYPAGHELGNRKTKRKSFLRKPLKENEDRLIRALGQYLWREIRNWKK